MSQEGVETVKDVVEAFNTRGLDAALAYVHPELAWHAPPEWLERQVYRGHEGLRQLAESWGENFDEYRLGLERVIDLGGNRALALLVQRGRIKTGGSPMELARVHDRGRRLPRQAVGGELAVRHTREPRRGHRHGAAHAAILGL